MNLGLVPNKTNYKRGIAGLEVVVAVVLIMFVGIGIWFINNRSDSTVTPTTPPSGPIPTSTAIPAEPSPTPLQPTMDTQPTQAAVTTVAPLDSQTYHIIEEVSASGDYVFTYFLTKEADALESQTCPTRLAQNGVLLDNSFLPSVPCLLGTGGLTSNEFHGWYGNNLVIDMGTGSVEVFTFPGAGRTVHIYEYNRQDFLATNADLSVWLMGNKKLYSGSLEKITFFDPDGQLLSTFNARDMLDDASSKVFMLEYDAVNDGFFIGLRAFRQLNVSYSFVWVSSMDVSTPKVLAEMGPVQYAGRGCRGGSYEPEEGVAVYKGLDCIALPENYAGSRNELRFAL